MKDNRLLQ